MNEKRDREKKIETETERDKDIEKNDESNEKVQ